ncbi:MAG: hypothetical protein COY38_01205 [Candidatus Aenigmarchaeota archaeon CG_4_10_14_0_8_um_filter_37_24]|nr:aspartate/glutamate racemase family protein [Candidatus Aenigmarchaeota archaeon]PIW40819.1 MAG: hypothetical protein COW21_05080 [Candidatus Aenigmarchaeota archaeon CG15_BIG_FIL_POST_REV_8_21_14_020_37_27]PIX50491.1 MAG: hypothetical protein COZ52_03800 [Candidatus Aenigmarchaeota archaeon CG_4_8_14_3_um_filter_37_24]PIY35601.1 MAG: hypothetical protein COZ04_02835 [Candidatus Aenigmarchaeota archaeon CG_4_10_14_3_um_filter_37_21]PIZ35979.1 MAG: hypothetical protein COY38_01205 [Candidatus
MKSKIIGIIGGMGPESTSDFYLDLTRMAQEKCSSRPSIVIHSLPIKFSIEESFIKNGTGKNEYLDWLIGSIKTLEKTGADFIVIPCNTVHIFIDKLRKTTKIPIVSITEETAKLCSKKNFKKVGILATTLVIRGKLYEKEFKKLSIQVVNVSKEDQKFVSNTIHKIVTLQATEKEKMLLEELVGKLKNQGAEAIVLGCTDLEILIKGDHEIEIIDSMHTLAVAAFNKLLLNEKQVIL